MDGIARSAFITSYTNILTQAWSSDDFCQRLESQPLAVLTENGLATVANARVSIVRTRDAEADLDAQIGLWERGHATGQYVLYVPYTPQIYTSELSDADLANVSGAGHACCCNPCCCQD